MNITSDFSGFLYLFTGPVPIQQRIQILFANMVSYNIKFWTKNESINLLYKLLI